MSKTAKKPREAQPAIEDGLWPANDARVDPARAAAAARLVREQIAPDMEPDFVTAMFDLLEKMHPGINAGRLDMEREVRAHFSGKRYIGKPDPATTAARVLAMFNGQNARTVARTLGISRASVFRHIKQPGAIKAGEH